MKLNNNKNIVIWLLLFTIFMLGLTFASVPLYNIFCKVTGFGGTVQRKSFFHDNYGKREIKVNFNADIDPHLNWRFVAPSETITTLTGKNSLIFFEAENLENKPITGMAIYNVTPFKAAKYFFKIACFCFEEQTLNPKEKVSMPVSFYIDKKMEDDPEMNDVDVITLSYTFFPY